MDYEKAYKEALKQAKKELNTCGSMDCDAARQIFRFFPQLKESEDERIRKWLYDYISNCPNNNFAFYGGVGKKAVLAYLEKQKEQKPMDKCDGCNNAKGCVTCVDGSEWAHYAEAEQKPAEWSEEDEKMLEKLLSIIGPSNGYAEIRDWLLRRRRVCIKLNRI